jgi:hypothetical protein
MKRLIVLFVLIALAAAGANAQTLLDNSYYTTGTELLNQAKDAFEAGDYDQAADLAAQAEEYFSQSDAYVEKMVLYQEAQTAIADAEAIYGEARKNGADKNFPDAFADAGKNLDAAREAMVREEYDVAIKFARAVGDFLAVAKAGLPLPATYKVILNKKIRDCLWRISAMAAVYGDALQWEKLYEANRKRLVDPNNPDLILPGQVLSIPSLYGEKRSGLYDPSKAYQPLPVPPKK